MRTLNLGILAHVDAGKTSLTERLLHDAGAVAELGSVDAGTTRTDSLALERQRGITIRTAVAPFTVGDTTVNLVDTPGHPDFVAEVERALRVLDGAVLVVSAVEGVQAQTRVLFRALRRLRLPTLLFVNKIDRGGADPEAVLDAVRSRLTPDVVPMGRVTGAGSRAAAFAPGVRDALDVLTRHDDDLLAAALAGAVPAGRLHRVLVDTVGRGAVHPVHLGSAITGAGVAELVASAVELLPAAVGDPAGPVAGTVYRIERSAAGERIAHVRLFSGAVRARDRVAVPAGPVTVTGGALVAGDIGPLHGLGDVRIGDAVGDGPPAPAPQFGPPGLEAVVVPARPGERAAVHAALARIADQDPLIALRPGLRVSLYGEVQKEVIAATLAAEHGLAITFGTTRPVLVERPVGTGAAHALIGAAGNPYLATVGLRVRRGRPGLVLDVERGSLPRAFLAAVETSVRDGLREGRRGREVVECAVALTHSGYWARQSHAHGSFDKTMSSTAGDFRALTRVVLATALDRAGVQVLEPVHRFRLEVPADLLDAVLAGLGRFRAVPLSSAVAGGVAVVDGTIPAAREHALRRRLPGLTRGEGILESRFDHQAPRASGP